MRSGRSLATAAIFGLERNAGRQLPTCRPRVAPPPRGRNGRLERPPVNKDTGASGYSSDMVSGHFGTANRQIGSAVDS